MMPVYIIRAGQTEMIKIGWADHDVEGRRRELQTAHYEDLTVIRIIEEGIWAERALHQHFHHRRVNREWFRFLDEMLTIVPQRPIRVAYPLILPQKMSEEAHSKSIEAATSAAGSLVRLAAKIGITKQAVSGWKRIPMRRAQTISKVFDIPLHELRPDIWLPPESDAP